MTVDREQIRRDAHTAEAATDPSLELCTALADHCLALLAELEQAERERDDFGPYFVRDCCRILGIDEHGYLRMDKIAARLAKVPALIEAATTYLHHVSHEQCTGPDGQCEAKCEHADNLRAALEKQPGETA